MEGKKVSVKFDASTQSLQIVVDSNADGQPSIDLKVHVTEIGDEVIDAIKAARAAKA